MEHSVKIERLPDRVTFPPEFGDRIHYDASSRRLVFRGFMSKAEFDRLCQVSDDWAYRRPLEDLFRLCSSGDAPRPGGLRGILSFVSSLWLA
jgi:hypothetical protein